MDRTTFDALTRLFAGSASRRAALAALLGAALGQSLTAARNKRRKGKRKQRAKGSSPIAAQAVDCLSLGHGVNVSGCNYTGEDHSGEDLSSSRMVGTIFRNGTLIRTDLSSSVMKNAVFRNATMCGADLRSSNVAGANFRDADLTGVSFKSSGGCNTATFTAGTTFCGTVMCGGNVRNDDCPGGLPAGFCCSTADCGPVHECRSNVCCTTDPVAAIAAAPPGGTVRICAGTYRVVDLEINQTLTVIGAGAGVTILDAEQAGRVVNIGEFTVEVRDLTITGGKVAGNGGGIANFGNLTLIGVTVRDNEAMLGGGGIVNVVGTPVLTLGAGTRIELNTAGLSGGGVLNDGAMTMQAGSRVENNTAGPSGGGGIFNSGSATIAPLAVVTGNLPDNCEPTIGTCT
jgi:hypothetical protein